MAQPTRERLQRVAQELGLHSLFLASADVKLLCLQRFVRLFAYGASTLMLASFLQSLDISKTRIGLFMTLTLVGDVCISFFLTLIADGLGRKSVLATGAALMIASGAIFATAGNYWILLAAAVLGVISPSGNEIGPFRAIEESVVAHLTAPENRSDIYAWYSLGGTAGTAFGMVSCGWLIHWLSNSLSWDLLEAYRAVFIGYAALGAVKLLLALALSGAVEAKPKQAARPAETAPLLDGETPLMDDDTSAGDPPTKPPSYWKSLLPEISRESAAVIVQLCLLFTLDSFASGLAPLSWLTFYFRTRYSIEEGRLGSVFFVTSIISSASMIVASSLAKRFGNVKTMVFTHLPSALFLALIPIPNNVYASLTFLILRACTQSMDTAPRSAFLAAIVLPAERTAVMGTVNVVKTTAQSLGPLITGLLADRGLFWVSFVAAGSLKATYDLGLLAVFKNHEGDRARREELAE